MSGESRRERSVVARQVSIVISWVPAVLVFLLAYLPLITAAYFSELANFIVLPILIVLVIPAIAITIYNAVQIRRHRAPKETTPTVETAMAEDPVPEVADGKKPWPSSPPGDIGATVGILLLTSVFLAISSFFISFTSINVMDESQHIPPVMFTEAIISWSLWLASVVWGIVLLARKKKAWLTTLLMCAGSAVIMMNALGQIGQG
jgi:hypothetical protein